MKSLSEKVIGRKARRVCLVLAGEVGPGGMLDYLLAWIKELRVAETEVLVLVSHELAVSEDLVFQAQFLGFQTEELPYPIGGLRSKYFRLIIEKMLLIGEWRFRGLRAKLAGFSPEVVHIVDDSILYPFIRKSILAVLGHAPLITVHDPKYHEGQFRSLLAFLAARYARKCVVRDKAVVHVHSRLLLHDEFEAMHPVIVEHQHPMPVTRVIRQRNILGREVVRFGFFGRIEKYKGIENLVPIFREFEFKYGKSYELSVVGRGDLEKFDASLLQGDITIINEFVPTARFHSLISEIDVLVLPYNDATQSGVAFLAAAYNMGVVAFNVGAVGEFVGNYRLGKCVAKGDFKAFAAEMCSLVRMLRRGEQGDAPTLMASQTDESAGVESE